MATAQTHPEVVQRRSSWASWAWLLLVLTILGLIAYHARTGAVSPRIANPEVTGVPRPVDFRYGNDFPIQEERSVKIGPGRITLRLRDVQGLATGASDDPQR